MSDLVTELRDKLASLTAEVDQAQALIDDARKLPNQQPSYVFELDARQLKLNGQRAQITNLRHTIDRLESPK